MSLYDALRDKQSKSCTGRGFCRELAKQSWRNFGIDSLTRVFDRNNNFILDLSDNYFGSAGAKSLSKSLKINTALTTLDLSDNKIGSEGTKSLSIALKINTSLTTLYFSSVCFLHEYF